MAERTEFTIESDQECLDLLGAYALDALSPDEKAAVEAWLPTSPACQEELNTLRMAVDAYALTVEEREPDPELRNRLWIAIQEEPRGEGSVQASSKSAQLRQSAPQGTSSPKPLPLAKPAVWTQLAAAIVLLLAGAAIAWAMFSRPVEEDTSVELGQFVTSDTAPAGTTTTGEVSYDADQNLMRLDLQNLPELPEGYIYQLWLVTDEGAVLPSVVFAPQSGETTSVAMVADPANVDILALTQEPAPIGSVSATTPIFAVADLDTTGLEST